jgi:hypothetical protein
LLRAQERPILEHIHPTDLPKNYLFSNVTSQPKILAANFNLFFGTNIRVTKCRP